MPKQDPETGRFIPASNEPPADEPQNQAPDPGTPPPDKGDAGKDMSGVNQLVDSFLSNEPRKPEPEPEPKPDLQKPAGPPKAEAPKAPVKTTKPKATTPPVQPQHMTAAEIASAAAEGVERAHAAARARTEKPEPKQTDAPQLPPKDQKRFTVLQQMEKITGDQYKGIADKYRASVIKEQDYRSKWEKEHPEQEYDPAADEHEAFYKANDVNWEDEDYIEAIASMRVSKVEQELAAQKQERERERRRSEDSHKAAPDIAKAQTDAARQYWKIHGDEFANLVDEKGAVDQKKLVELAAQDPVNFQTRLEAAEKLDAEVATIHSLMRGLVDFNPENPTHAAIAALADEKEQALLERPAEEQTDERGRPFVTAVAYNKLSESDRKRVWTFSANDLAAMKAAKNARETKAKIDAEEEKFKRTAAARGYKLDGKPAEQREALVDETVDPGNDGNWKPLSPSTDGGSKLAGQSPAGGKPGQTGLDSFALRFLG